MIETIKQKITTFFACYSKKNIPPIISEADKIMANAKGYFQNLQKLYSTNECKAAHKEEQRITSLLEEYNTAEAYHLMAAIKQLSASSYFKEGKYQKAAKNFAVVHTLNSIKVQDESNPYILARLKLDEAVSLSCAGKKHYKESAEAYKDSAKHIAALEGEEKLSAQLYKTWCNILLTPCFYSEPDEIFKKSNESLIRMKNIIEQDCGNNVRPENQHELAKIEYAFVTLNLPAARGDNNNLNYIEEVSKHAADISDNPLYKFMQAYICYYKEDIDGAKKYLQGAKISLAASDLCFTSDNLNFMQKLVPDMIESSEFMKIDLPVASYAGAITLKEKASDGREAVSGDEKNIASVNEKSKVIVEVFEEDNNKLNLEIDKAQEGDEGVGVIGFLYLEGDGA